MFSVAMFVERSITIDKPIEEVFTLVSDFNTWTIWSPWYCLERESKVSVSGEARTLGHRQEWDGERIGKGQMELIEISPNESLLYDLEFLSPWKSRAKAKFSFDKEGNGTKVTWILNGSLPFYIFFFKKMMEAMVGSDYERGLRMLKEYMETGKVASDLAISGEIQKPGFSYVGIKRKSTIKEMPQIMSNDFKTLHEYLAAEKLPLPKEFLSFYHKFDFVKGECEFTSALNYDQAPDHSLDLIEGKVDNHRCAQVVHTGAYENLGNAWTSIMGYQRHKKLKSNKKVPWYEVYLNDPNEVSREELKTEVNIPIR